MSLPILVIFGDRTANEVFEAATASDQGSFASIEKLYFEPTKFLQKDFPRLTALATQIFYHAAIANERIKQQVVSHCDACGWIPRSIIHPSAIISPSARIAPGTFIAPLAVVSSNAVLDQHVMVHIHASIGHDSHISEFSAVLPGARICGNVKIGKRSLIGSNAFVAAGITIGDDCQVDALTYVLKSLPSNHVFSTRAKSPVLRVDCR
ncbi:MAG: hypothetical protein KDB03_08585 [Planctomycetales bacterium]|nr:hypothetical protein [Planctomycetales bacterium]